MRTAGLPDQGYGTTALPRPRFRGVLHLWSFFGAVIVGVVIVITRSGVAESLAATIYAIGVCTMFGVSMFAIWTRSVSFSSSGSNSCTFSRGTPKRPIVFTP